MNKQVKTLIIETNGIPDISLIPKDIYEAFFMVLKQNVIQMIENNDIK